MSRHGMRMAGSQITIQYLDKSNLSSTLQNLYIYPKNEPNVIQDLNQKRLICWQRLSLGGTSS